MPPVAVGCASGWLNTCLTFWKGRFCETIQQSPALWGTLCRCRFVLP
jgi:hypothetical protein